MPNAFRHRVTHAATVGMVAAALAVATQYFIALPIGDQPSWMLVLAMVAASPAAYALIPLQGIVQGWFGQDLGTGYVMQVTTPFGPALRGGTEDLLLLALGTIVMVGLVAYAAAGIQEMMDERQLRHG
jgi:hypothetical protein